MTQLALCFALDGAGRTRLVERRAAYPYSVTAPVNRAGTVELTLQSISGGLYAGESLAQHINLREGAAARLVQPAATTVRRGGADAPARQNIRLEAGENAQLVYASRPLIMLPGAALAQNWEIILSPGARVMFWDGFVSHSPKGEAPDWSLTSRVNVRGIDGKLLAAERMQVQGATLGNGFQGMAGTFSAFGKFWCLGQSPITSAPRFENLHASHTALPNNSGCVIALSARDGGALCAAMEQILSLLDSPPG